MIVLKEIGFSNMFSYGDSNVFNIQDRVTQLLGKNGDGKSSIAAIIEELFYNKNSRGIKKADVQNRYSGVSGYSCYGTFSVLGVDYRVEKTVTSTAKVKLYRGSEDISGHTTTQTYKNIETLFHMEFSTFTKLVYQSMVSSLDFLSATDANRKKFLVSLLGLEKYVEAEKVLKEAYKLSKSDVGVIQGSLGTITQWLEKHRATPVVLDLLPVPEILEDEANSLVDYRVDLGNIKVHNTAVAENNTNIKALAKIVEVAPAELPTVDLKAASDNLTIAKQEVAVLSAAKTTTQAEVNKIIAVKEECHVCGSQLDVGNKTAMLSHAKDSLALAVSNLDSAKVTVKDLSSFVVAATAVKTKHENYLNYLTKIKEAESRLDSSKPTELLNFETLSTLIRDVTKSILDKKLEVQAIITKNNQIAVHNSTVEYEVQQLASFTKELAECQKILDVATVLQTRLDVLVKAMGSKGLVAYKVESMVKVFEDLINQYLHVLADGEFALGFTVEDTKLVLNMYSNSKLIDIKSLSSGEFNRVNTATLLAVRKMMTSMSKMDINLLILDEVVSVLDQEGKDTLIEVLLKEQNLNSIVVSHGYEHPLASKVTVTKEHNISRLDNE